MLHDIGKNSTPDSILLKAGKLTDIANRVYAHHERCDGKDCPRG